MVFNITNSRHIIIELKLRIKSTKKLDESVITIRPNQNDLKILREFVHRNNSSLNSVIKQMISDYVQWDLYAARTGWIILPQVLLQELLDLVNTKDMHRLAKIASATHKTSLSLTGNVDLNTFLNTISVRLRKSGFIIKISEHNNEILLIVSHNLGIKWSYFCEILYSLVLKDLGFDSKFECFEASWSVRIMTNGKSS